ncbi:MAG: ABC transporter permease [Propionibacteriaceae bacterium]|nr:ABC transporter permease [Propionibacteriaceae bacterium]
MRRGVQLREAWLNVISGTTRAVTLGVVALTLMLLAGALDLQAIRSIDQRAHAFQTQGAATLVIDAQGAVDGPLCTALAGQPGVRAAGALRRVEDTTYAAAPQRSLPVYEVTPQFPAVVDPQLPLSPPAGVVLSEEAAAEVGLSAGDTLHTAMGSARISGVYRYPEDGRRRGFGYALLVPVRAEGAFDSCWVEQWPRTENLDRLIRGVLVPGSSRQDVQPAVGQLNPTLGVSFDAREALLTRPTLWALAATFIGLFCVAFAAGWLRRLERAAALHLGVTPRDLTKIALAETALWIAPALALGVAGAILHAASGDPADFLTSLSYGLGFPLFAALGAFLGAATAVRSIRESDAFRLFKER